MYKKYFPYFKNNTITYLDNAATTQKPLSVINEMVDFYSHYNSNIHRSSHTTANKTTIKFEHARKNIQSFINAPCEESIIFTKGVTESINFIASSFAKKFDTIIISSLEHHSNILPWQMQSRTLHQGLEVVKYNKNFEFDYEDFEKLLKKHPNSFVSITHVSNAFGHIHDIKKISELTHKYNSYLMVDGAQSLVHFDVNVKDLDVDFYCISSHKTYGPTGVGAVYIKDSLLKDVSPYQTGGATINDVSYNTVDFLPSPYIFEAGTQNIEGVIGFSKALDFIKDISYEKIIPYEQELYKYLHDELEKIKEIELYNDTTHAIGSKSFNIKNINHDDIGILLDKQKIAIRVGHHCAQPIMKELKIKGTIRASIALYNNKEDIDLFIVALKKAIMMLKD